MRSDGFRLHNVDPMYTVASYIMNHRYDSMNMITLDIPITPIRTYMNEKRKAGTPVSHLAIMLSAYLRVVSEFPELNRFIVNSKPYARNEISVSMVVLKAGQMDHGTMSKIYLETEDTIFDVNRKIVEFVDANKNTPENNGTEKMIRILLSVPGLVRVGVGLFKFLEKHALLPKVVADLSPFHASLLISDLASIRTNHIYHHVYEFGTTSLGLTMGNLREVPIRKGGEVAFERCMPLGLVMDERICSGSYFALAFEKLQRYLKNPALLETPAEVVKVDEALTPKQLEKMKKIKEKRLAKQKK
ncbi:MAG: 2-oxo acid dehydrogenase subunit E2 [Clostridia bacterium]|nr:2-oxo acid dehydrogenase subunit E2 [Clostridia bacterium]